jgi:hypothetical protein
MDGLVFNLLAIFFLRIGYINLRQMKGGQTTNAVANAVNKIDLVNPKIVAKKADRIIMYNMIVSK